MRTTSKILLAAWMALGIYLLIKGGLGASEAAVWTVGLAAMVWNRVDSRSRGYKISMESPSGIRLAMDVKDEKKR